MILFCKKADHNPIHLTSPERLTEKPSKPRLVQFDLLKVFAMVMVVTLHFWSYATDAHVVDPTQPQDILNYIFFQGYLILCHSGVPLFILASGYFSAGKEWGFNWKRVTRIWFYAFFYGLLFFILLHGSVLSVSGIKDCMKSILPLTGNTYWFITNYLALAVFAPFMTILSNRLSRHQYLTLLVAAGLFGITCFFDIPFGNAVGASFGFSLYFFCLLFMVGAFIRKFNVSLPAKTRTFIVPAFILAVFVFYFVTETRASGQIYVKNSHYNDLSVFVGIAVFLWIKDWTPKGLLRSFAALAPYALGVYLITENMFVREWLWTWMNRTIHPNSNSWMLIPMGLVIPVLVFFATALVDMLVKQGLRLSKVEMAVDHFSEWMDKLSDRFIHSLNPIDRTP